MRKYAKDLIGDPPDAPEGWEPPSAALRSAPVPPLAPDLSIVTCTVCGGAWDDWHERRAGKAVWTTYCPADRLLARIFGGRS